jgi:hypothetical protein
MINVFGGGGLVFLVEPNKAKSWFGLQDFHPCQTRKVVCSLQCQKDAENSAALKIF